MTNLILLALIGLVFAAIFVVWLIIQLQLEISRMKADILSHQAELKALALKANGLEMSNKSIRQHMDDLRLELTLSTGLNDADYQWRQKHVQEWREGQDRLDALLKGMTRR